MLRLGFVHDRRYAVPRVPRCATEPVDLSWYRFNARWGGAKLILPMESAKMTPESNTASLENGNCDGSSASSQPPRARPVASKLHMSARHRLGPLVSVVAMDHPVVGRLYAAGLTGVVVTLLVTATNLAPSRRHLGTHQQLGLPPCGFMMMTGLPCPTCGMTTAFSCAVRGQLIEAARAQVAGLVLAAGVVGTGVIAMIGVVTGKRPKFNWYRISPTRVLWFCMALFVLAWGVNVIRVLMENRATVG